MHKFINKNKKEKVDQVVKPMLNSLFAKDTDPLGSYTGKPVDKNDKPIQDADDL